LPTADDTLALGERLGRHLRAGDVVVLAGPLGAGKTVLAKGIARGMDVEGPITSPSFVLARLHRPRRSGHPAMVHVDVYRLLDNSDADLMAELDSLDLDTDLPIGRGMGSSAALADALVRADARHRGETLGFDALFERAFAVERVFHGNPSGVDHGVSLTGGVVRYLRAGPTFTRLAAPTWRLVVLDSGVAGDTAEMVAGVRARRVEPVLARIGDLVGEAERVLHDPRSLGDVLDENHARLQEIGVSTPALDALVGLARAAGAFGAKLAGAGGGGVVIALVDEPGPVLAAAARAGVSAFEVRPAPASAP
jgi:mevalonate kinase